jgi:hypothetical protein
MAIRKRRGRTPVPRSTRGLLIVAREEVVLYHSLNRAFGGPGGITVLLDRRQADRRRTVQAVAQERRRRRDRRSLPRTEDDLGQRRYVLARPPDRRPRN